MPGLMSSNDATRSSGDKIESSTSRSLLAESTRCSPRGSRVAAATAMPATSAPVGRFLVRSSLARTSRARGRARPSYDLLVECECAVTDHLVARPGGVAGVAQVEDLDSEMATAGDPRKPVDSRTAARFLALEPEDERDDLRGGPAIALVRVRVRMVVREIRADHDQRFGSAPQLLEHLADHGGRRVRCRDRDDLRARCELLNER